MFCITHTEDRGREDATQPYQVAKEDATQPYQVAKEDATQPYQVAKEISGCKRDIRLQKREFSEERSVASE